MRKRSASLHRSREVYDEEKTGSNPKTRFTSEPTRLAIFLTPENSFESQTKIRELVKPVLDSYDEDEMK